VLRVQKKERKEILALKNPKREKSKWQQIANLRLFNP